MKTQERAFVDEIGFAELFARVRNLTGAVVAEWRLLLKVTAVAGILGVAYALGSPVEYSANMRLLPYKSGGSGGLSGLAGLAGVRLPMGGAEQAIPSDLYPEVTRSLSFRVAIAETPLRFSSIDTTATSVEYFARIRKPSLNELFAAYTVGLPGRMLSGSRETQSTLTEPPATDSGALPMYDLNYLRLVDAVGSRVTVSYEKQTSILRITGMMPDPYAAADLVRVTADELMRRIIDFESGKASEQLRFISAEHKKARDRYEHTQRELARFTDRNRSLMSATAQIDRDRLQREYDMAYELYQQFSRELEQARVKVNQDTPLFAVLEQTVVPNTRISPNRRRIVTAAIFLGLFTGVGFVLGRSALKGQLGTIS